METLFLNPDNQFFFDNNGFYKSPFPVLDKSDIDTLTEFLTTSGIYRKMDYDVSKDHPNHQLVYSMFQLFEDVVMPKLKKVINTDSNFVTGSFLVKAPKSKNVIIPHQDDNFTDESKNYYAVTCWIPLVDVDVNNGCIGILKGSNKVFDNVCPRPTSLADNINTEYYPLLVEYMEWIPMKAGEVLVFDHKTVHASLPNKTNNPRLSLSLLVTHKEADFYNYFIKPGTTDRILKYKIDREFYMNYSNDRLVDMYNENKCLEEYQLLEELEYTNKQLTLQELEQRLVEAGNVRAESYRKYFVGDAHQSIFSRVRKVLGLN